MTDPTLQPFERQLAAALDDYANDAGPLPDPFVRARDIARAHPRRRWLIPTPPLSLRPVLIVALIVVALAAALVLVGSHLRSGPPPIIPAQLFGRWSADALGDPFLDLNASTLLGTAGPEAPDLGRVVGFEGDPASTLEARVEIDGAAGCLSGRYQLLLHREGSGELPGPTPAGTDTGPVIIDTIRFVALSDRCTRRVAALVGAPWQRVVHPLLPGQTLDSLAFTEPFELQIPATLTSAGGSVGTMHQTRRTTVLAISHAWWNGFFLDDEPVYRDLCDPSAGKLTELPSDLAGIRAWLRPAELRGLGGPTEVTVDGRTALRWANHLDCGESFLAITPDVYGDVIYAIPTPHDLILWAFRFDTASEEAIGDAIAQHLHFQ